MRSMFLMGLVGLSSWTAYASVDANAPVTAPRAVTENAPVAPWSGIYVFDQEARLTPTTVILNGEVHDNATGVSVEFSANEPVVVSYAEDGLYKVSPLLDDEERGDTPEALLVTAEDLGQAGPRFAELGDEKVLAERYSVYEPTNTAGRHWHHARRRRRHGRIGHCAGYVKRRLGVNVRGNGRDVTRALARIGFQKADCESPRVGTVASWTGGWHRLGHTGIWNGRCFAYDRGCGNPGKGYHLVGCVHR